MADNPSGDTSENAPSDPKDRFRQALERKRAQQAERASNAHGESKVHGEHAAAGGKRTFRRKSG
jgi:hypothetical protein